MSVVNYNICDNISVRGDSLYFGKKNAVDLAKKYATPLYVMDEEKIREKCRIYVNAMKKYYGDNAITLFASKACSFKRMYEIVKEEGMGCDVVSAGEIYTALKAGFDLSKTYFHSNNKTDEDIKFAIENKVGYFVVDNVEELDCIQNECEKQGVTQKVLLRLTPGIDTHTYEAVNTGKVDSKFGTAIETGQAFEIVKYALGLNKVELMGFHCHIGSQVFDSDTFIRGAEIMLEFIASVKEKFGYEAKELDLGGGYGVKYVEHDGEIDIDSNIKTVCEYVKTLCKKFNLAEPKLIMEPGRSIVADAGLTLYTVGTVKTIPGYKNYVSVDGGMTDNPRFALYGSAYTVAVANKMNDKADFKASVVGRCCESGDIIQENVMLPRPQRGDILAVFTTGAYNYSMSSNYNRILKPAVVMINGDQEYVAVKRETLDDIIRNDI